MQPFLTANWRYPAMLNYVVDSHLIAPLVPSGTEIDFENGKAFLSVVGFLSLDTHLMSMPVPLHRDFEEVNLRSMCGGNRRTHGGAAWFSSARSSRGTLSHSLRARVMAKIMLPFR